MGLESLDTRSEETSELVTDVKLKQSGIEVNKQLKVLETETDTIVSQDEDLESLADAVEGMEALIKSGETNTPVFSLLYRHAERLHVKLGGNPTTPRSGNENLTLKSLEAHAIVGFEGFMDTVKGGADNFVTFIKKIIAYIKDLFLDWFSSEKQIKSKVEKLKRRLANKGVAKEVKVGAWGAQEPAYQGTEEVDEKFYQRYREIDEKIHHVLMAITDFNSIEKLYDNLNKIREGLKSMYPYNAPARVMGKYTTLSLPGYPSVRFLNTKVNSFPDSLEFMKSLRFSDNVLPYQPKAGKVNSEYDATKLNDTLDTDIPKAMARVEFLKSYLRGLEQMETRALNKNQDNYSKFIKSLCGMVSAKISRDIRWTMKTVKMKLDMVEAHIA
ncbi:internal head protein [Vibrio phage USC-1]|uniref:Uncharacterized protein n=2 Tax=Aphroditevirus USC1 TaxID=2846605 RepID=A0A514A2G1_9CAUD|nr:internal head protein [Vibrio phage USC-1]QCW23250.1 hypothetical protein [Vibrio phage 5 TSL-2019]QDH47478.1 hypothetical protein [Vibrio phage USC-1]